MNSITPSARLLEGRIGDRLRTDGHDSARNGGKRSNKPGERITLPQVSRPVLRWFSWYSRRYLKRHFHSLRVSRAGLPPAAEGRPLVVYANHASWWDALIWLVLADEFYGGRTTYAPISAVMLERYGLFRRLGFFGVEPGTRWGAVQFLRTSLAVLDSPRHLLAVTPQGRFADHRERPPRFEPGLGYLASKVKTAVFVPLALEYVFWEERLPEVLGRFGQPAEIRSHGQIPSPGDWTRLFEQSMAATQDALAVEAQQRRPEDFQTILRGGAGQGGIYDAWQWLTASLQGKQFRKEHGSK